ncbi:ABC transporter ATP-binding protein [Amycolatopsis antarctica]|uniref:ABC transporter ATP-binding protein n=1 Tax=Amycolatopsis antarctica TaxID=1854586 RepID=A0A263D5F1_9PSEU|nr:ABC transporter ATP-binding protein [Amycolatopsis antarctica]OZM73690.1 ABC transporter ATP-binding protein [Amycolatopsis antarctica]
MTTEKPAERPAFETTGLGVRYRRNWALRDCTVSVPAGRVVALVGPNGAGKTTLLHTLVGLLRPDAGVARLFGGDVASDENMLARMAFVAQDKPLYDYFTVAEMLRFGRELNPRWDGDFARARVNGLGIPLSRKVGKLSGGQRAQVAITMALAKRPDLLVLDEPLASLDPLARDDVMRALMGTVAETGTTVLMSSHVVSDLVDTCDWLVVLNGGQVQVSGDIDELLACHRVLSGPAGLAEGVAGRLSVVTGTRGERQATLLIRNGTEPPVLDPQWTQRPAGLEEMVLAYLRSPESASLPRPAVVPA